MQFQIYSSQQTAYEEESPYSTADQPGDIDGSYAIAGEAEYIPEAEEVEYNEVTQEEENPYEGKYIHESCQV